MNQVKQTFNSALRLRQTVPLERGGLYKLKEASDRLLRASENIDGLIGCSPAGGNKCSLKCCTWEDRREWLKGALLDIPYRMGYEVLPAVAALSYDGLSVGNAQRLLGMAKIESNFLLDDVHDIRLKIDRDMGVEFGRWNTGESLIQVALDRAITLITKIVSFAENELPLHGVSAKMYQATQLQVMVSAEGR